jgi:RNA polymerase sigma-70 factor, ECF subfamily
MSSTSRPDEAALLEAARRGDHTALSRLLERHQAQIYRFGLKLCGNPEDAKDVLQETMLGVARNLSGFRGEAALSTWLYTVARSFCAKHRRRSKFAPEPELSLEQPKLKAQLIIDGALGPDAALADKQRDQALHAAIDGLGPMYKEVLVLRDMEGLPAHEVAQVLGVSVEAVKSRLHRARKAVRERFMASETEPSPAAVGCPDIVELWSEQLEGELSAIDCARMQSHIDQCSTCRHDCETLKRTLSLCRAAESGTRVPEAVQQAVQRALQDFLDQAAGSTLTGPATM